MTSFKLDISSLEENIALYRDLKNKYLSDIDTIYESLKNADSCWTDPRSTVFIDVIKDDKYNIDTYFNNLDLLYKQVEILMNEFENLLFRFGCNKKGIVRYNDEKFNYCVRSLNNAFEYLDRAIYYIDSCNFKFGISVSSKVYELRREIRMIRATIENIANQVKSFKAAVDKTLSDTGYNVDKIGEINLDIDPNAYSWRLAGSKKSNSRK